MATIDRRGITVGNTVPATLSELSPSFDIKADVEAADISSTVDTIRTGGYYAAGDGGGALYSRAASEPSHEGKIQSADGAWWEIAETHINVLQFGSVGDGVTDDTAAFQAAIDAVGASGRGGTVLCPGENYKILGTLSFTQHGITLRGAGRYTTLTFENGSADCISIDGTAIGGAGVYYCQIVALNISHIGKTGGATVKMYKANICTVQDVGVDQCWNAFDLKTINSVTLRDVIVTNVNGSFGVKFWSLSDGTERSDVLTLTNISINCGFLGADGILWDGHAHTLRIFGGNALHAHIGLKVTNSGNSGSNFPSFLQAFDWECDGCTLHSVRVEAGESFYLDACSLSNNSGSSGQGSADQEALYIAADTGASITRKIGISNSFIGNTQRAAAFIDANDVVVSNCLMGDASKAGSGSYPVMTIGANAHDVSVADSRLGPLFGQTPRETYGVVVTSGAVRVALKDNDYNGCVTGDVLNNSTTGSVYRTNGFDKSGNPLIGVKSYIDGNLEHRIDNTAATASAQARRQLSTGTANSFQLDSLIDQGGTPIMVSSVGSGVTAWYRDGDTQIFRTRGGTEIFRATSSGLTLASGGAVSGFDTDGTLAGNSDSKVATQKAVKTYADALIAANDAMVFKGATDCSGNPNYPAGNAGETYRVSVAGKIGGASGVVVEAGDFFICNTDGTASGNQATVGTKWNVIQTNIDGAVVGPASVTDGHAALFDGTTGKLIKTAGFAPQPVNANLTAEAGLTGAADKVSYYTGSGAKAVADFPSYGRSLAAASTASAARALLNVAPFVVTLSAYAGATPTWTNMPLAVSMFAARVITKVDLTNFTQVRFILNKQGTAGVSGAKMFPRYYTSGSFTDSDYLAMGASSTDVSVAIDTASNVILDSGWINLTAGAQADVFISLFGSGGDGGVDPQFNCAYVHFR